jgi:hypothetical protein
MSSSPASPSAPITPGLAAPADGIGLTQALTPTSESWRSPSSSPSASPSTPPPDPPALPAVIEPSTSGGSGDAWGETDGLSSAAAEAELRVRRRRLEQTARQRRALSDPIYFIDAEVRQSSVAFRVLGTSQSSYTVDFFLSRRHSSAAEGQPVWKCACRDFEIRRRPCKHIQFVWYRVLGVDPDSLHSDGSGSAVNPFFDSVDAVRERLNNHRVQHGHSVQALADQEQSQQDPTNDQASEIKSTATLGPKVPHRPFVGQNCPICYEQFCDGDAVFFCEHSCGNSVHRGCYEACVRFSQKTLCPYCRRDMRPDGLDLSALRTRKRRRHRY